MSVFDTSSKLSLIFIDFGFLRFTRKFFWKMVIFDSKQSNIYVVIK